MAPCICDTLEHSIIYLKDHIGLAILNANILYLSIVKSKHTSYSFPFSFFPYSDYTFLITFFYIFFLYNYFYFSSFSFFIYIFPFTTLLPPPSTPYLTILFSLTFLPLFFSQIFLLFLLFLLHFNIYLHFLLFSFIFSSPFLLHFPTTTPPPPSAPSLVMLT